MPRGIALGLDALGVGVPAGGGGWWNPNGDIPCEWGAYQPKWAASFLASLIDLTGNGNNAGDPGGRSHIRLYGGSHCRMRVDHSVAIGHPIIARG